MSTVAKDSIEDALSEVVDPHTGLDLVTGKSLKDCVVDNQSIVIDLVLGYPAKEWHPKLRQQVVDVISTLGNIESVEVRIDTQVVSHEVQKGVTPLKNVHNVIAVASGKCAVLVALMAFLKSGDHLLMVDSAYGPTRALCDGLLTRFGITTTYYDPLIGAGIALSLIHI